MNMNLVQLVRPLRRKATDVVPLHLSQVREVFAAQARAVAQLADRIDEDYLRAVEILCATEGHVIVCGMGKSGLIGKKIAATLASTGTPAFFLHPGEAFHGDLGMVTRRDAMLILSYSGETEEVVRILPFLRQAGVPIVSLVGCMDSALARASDVALDCSVEREVCPNNLAPTSSTLAALAMGDALAVSLIKAREFNSQDFARFHPGGRLGKKLTSRVQDVMRRNNLPVAPPEQTVRETLLTITRARLGIVLVVEEGKIRGIITDGDLRRAMQKHDDVLDVPLWRIMTKNPVTVRPEMLIDDAEELMRRKKIKSLVVVDAQGQLCGVLDFFDE